MKKFNEEVKQEILENNLLDTVLEIGWNYLQAIKEGESE